MRAKILRYTGIHSDGIEADLEIYVADTNDINPYREAKECAITVTVDDKQIDYSLDEEDLDEMIDYLKEVRGYIEIFNANSKPKEE